jgi:GPH family glycoside/pentoside/hexuronide:cation symporter
LAALGWVYGGRGGFVSRHLKSFRGKRLGKRRATLGLWIVSLIVNWAPLTLRLFGFFPENHSPFLVPLLRWFGLFGSIFAAANSIIMSSMLADIVEDSQLKTGRRSEGLFFSANAFVQKAVSGLGGFISGVILAVAHFPATAGAGAITTDVVMRLAWIYVPIVLGLYGLSMLAIAFYTITRGSHENAVAALELES